MSKTINWLKIKNEYLNTNISQRKLAEKYEISFNTLKAKASKEEWAKTKETQYHKITTKVQQKTVEKIADEETERIAKILATGDKLQAKIDESIGQLNMVTDMFGKVHKTDVIDVHKLRKLVSALKEIKEIMHTENNNNLSKLDEVLDKIEGNI